MEVKAVGKYIRVQPRKVRIIADEMRGRNVNEAAAILQFHPSKSAGVLRKVLMSAVANAVNNDGLDQSGLRIKSILIDEGPRAKRMMPRAQGRGYRILKKTSHVTVVVEEYDVLAAVKPHGTFAKPRPTFGKPAAKKSGSVAVNVAQTEEISEEVKEDTSASE